MTKIVWALANRSSRGKSKDEPPAGIPVALHRSDFPALTPLVDLRARLQKLLRLFRRADPDCLVLLDAVGGGYSRIPMLKRGDIEVRFGSPLTFEPTADFQPPTDGIDAAVRPL